MLQENHRLAPACPSCGARLRVDPGRMSRPLQCPKCLNTILLEPAPAKALRTAEPAGPADRYPELLMEHAELAERYAGLAADYDRLVTRYAELARQLSRLGRET